MTAGAPPPAVTGAAALSPGRRVGRYEIIDELGRGGMAVVYLARQLDLDRFVALKELSELRAADPEAVNRFFREARISGALAHPNIVTVYDRFECDGVTYLAMEYLPAGSLRALMGRLSFAQIVGVLEGVLAGLAQAETSGLVHRDLKPENLLITSDGTVKIADFGIAKAVGAEATTFRTATGMTLGTPTYMAPEQAQALQLGPWTDLYSLGVIAYEMLAGRVPFDGERSVVGIMLAHISDPPPPLTTLPPDVPAGIAPWVMRLLAKDPRDRYQSAPEAWEALEDIVLTALGPRWRRSARLPTDGRPGGASKRPLTPPAFKTVPPPRDTEDEYDTFVWREPPRPPEHTTDVPLPVEGFAGPAAEVTTPPPVSVTPAAPPAEPPPAAAAPEPAVPAAAAPEPAVPAAAAPEPAVPAATLPPVERQTPPEATLPPTLPPRAAPAAPRAPEPGRPRARRTASIAGALIVAAALGTAAGAATATHGPATPASRAVESGIVQLQVPAAWRRVATSTPPVPLQGREPVLLAHDGARLYAARTTAAGVSLLPPETLTSLGTALPKPERVRLGRVDALRYRDVRAGAGAGVLTIFAAQTTDGVATLVCAQPAGERAAGAACEQIAASLRIKTATALPLGPDATYAATLDRRLHALAVRRGHALHALRRAATPARQARAARDVAAAFAAARTRLLHASPTPRDASVHRAIVESLQAATRGYRSLAGAAAAGKRRAYDAGRRKARDAETMLDSAVRALRRLGYRVAGGS